jgi:VCBS repeat protein
MGELYPTTIAIAQSGSVGNYTLTATLSGAGSTAPTGTVSFLNATNENAVLAKATLVPGAGGPFFVSGQEFANFGGQVVVGDFNGDGILDLAAEYCDEYVTSSCIRAALTVFLGNGDGTFTQSATTDLGYTDNPFPGNQNIVVGDFNNDGILDIAIANSDNNTLMVLLGNGDGTFSAAASPATGSNPSSIAVGDFNGDGNLDVAVLNVASTSLTVLLGNGDGTFRAAASPATGSEPSTIAVGDFN